MLTEQEHQYRLQEVKRLRKEGFRNPEIAKKLGLMLGVVSRTAQELIKEDEIKRQYPRGLPEEEWARREERIITLRNQGLSNCEIAKKIGVTVSIVQTMASRLIRQGKLIPHHLKKIGIENLDEKAVEKIIGMVRERATLKEVGKVFGVTNEFIRIVVAKIIEDYGKEVFNVEDPWLNISEVSDYLGFSPGHVRILYDKYKVPYRKRSDVRKSWWLIRKSTMEQLQAKLQADREQEVVCTICQCKFTASARKNQVFVCEKKECYAEYRRRYRSLLLAKLTEHGPSLESLHGWQKEVWKKLRSHRIPKDEVWLVLKEAARRTGLTVMQVHWLRIRRIVRTKPHLTKTWRGQPAIGYAASEMKVIRQVMQAYAQRNGKAH